MTLRIGIIGGAGHTDYVPNGIAELGDATVCAIARGGPGDDLEQIRQSSRAAPGVAAYDDYRELLSRETPDIVAVLPEFHLHAEIAAEALRRGIPVFCEKPLALTLDGVDRVRQARQASGTPLGMMLAFRYAPSFYTARKLVRQGAIGQPAVGYAQKSYKHGTRPDFYRKRATFGGIIPWIGIHAIDWFQWISGRTYRAVTAFHSKLHYYPDYPEMEDAATCLFELDNGGTAVMSFDFLRPEGAPTHGDDRLRLVGDEGAIEVRGDTGVELITKKGVVHVAPSAPPHGLFADFALSVKDRNHTGLLGGDEAIRITEIALKTRDAADRHERVAL